MSTQLERIEGLLREHVERSTMFRESTNKRLDAMSAELAQNTEVTTQVRDAARVVTWLRKAVIWLGALGAGAVGIWQAWGAFAGDGRIGPTP
jgi:hypothetical protein